MTKKYTVQLARLVRETKTLVIEVAEGVDVEDAMQEAWENDEGDDWDADCEWGADEGTHTVIGEVE